jgi:hypothetical protein
MARQRTYKRDPTFNDGPTIVETIHNLNLLYCNDNPDNDPCPICKPDIGRVFIPGTEPYVPRHKHCYCYYIPTRRPPTPTRARPR